MGINKNELPRLEELALNELARYIKVVSIHLLKEVDVTPHHKNKRKNKLKSWLETRMKSDAKPKEVSTETQGQAEIRIEVCHCLQVLFEETLTPSTVNEVSAKLLQTLSSTILSKEYFTDRQQAKPVVQQLVNAMMPTSVTRFQLTPVLYCLDTFICTRLASLTRIEELELIFISDISDLRMLVGIINPNLEELIMKALEQLTILKTFRFSCYCTDNIATTVTLHCPLMQRLDFSCSRVTNIGLELITRLHHLQELNVARTMISDSCISLLQNLAENNVDLKSFGCSALSIDGLEILTSRFQGIVSLNLVSFRCSLAPLKQLLDLKVLKLQSGCFAHIEGFLITSGYQLVLLELGRIAGVDVNIIGEYCPALTNLQLRYCTTLDIEQVDSPLPGFVSLESLTIHTRSDLVLVAHIITQSKNVKHVAVYSKGSATLECVEAALQKNRLINLEDLTIFLDLLNVAVDRITQNLQKFTNLRVLNGIYSWGLPNEDVNCVISSLTSIKFG